MANNGVFRTNEKKKERKKRNALKKNTKHFITFAESFKKPSTHQSQAG